VRMDVDCILTGQVSENRVVFDSYLTSLSAMLKQERELTRETLGR